MTLEGSLRAADARVASGHLDLLEQRAQVRELEQWGLDASMARALLRIYEEAHAMSILERRRLCGVMATASFCEPFPVQDNDRISDTADAQSYQSYHRKAA
jgi:hypothetical protein